MASLLIKRIPPELHARLKQRAAAHRRSLNSETILLLEQVLGVPSPATGAVTAQQPDLSEAALAGVEPAVAARLRALRELGESLANRGVDFNQWRQDAAESRR